MSVDENMLAKRARMNAKKKATIKEETSSLDHLLRKIEKTFDRLTIADKPKTPIRNPNFRVQQQPQFRI